MRKILLYHIYPVNNWRDITEYLFQKLLFNRIVVHVSLPSDNAELRDQLKSYFMKYKVDEILFSINSGFGEVDALKNFVKTQDLGSYDIMAYMHCKGVTKPDNKHIFNWTKLMRHFIIEEMGKCEQMFKNGFVTFGINKSVPEKGDEGFIGSNFFYEGNFVSINLNKIDLTTAVANFLEDSYYGVEGFWGKLCSYEKGYTAFDSGVNHYLMSVPEKDYTTWLGRMKYNSIKQFYRLRSKISF